jgi:sugar O-acyltransferase (sialic acid O-acetyltransferase NeuD family)
MSYSLSIIGFGGHAKVLLDTIGLLGLKVNFLYDDNFNLDQPLYFMDKVVSPINFEISENAIIGIGDNYSRKEISIKAVNKVWALIIHPTSIISTDTFIDEGSVIMAGSIIQTGSRIGKHCIINTGSSIDHNCYIGDYVHISPNVALTGGISIGEGTHVGVGACVIPGIKIGKWAIIGAGAVIIRDVPDYAVVVGNPGKIIKYNYEK